MRVWLIKEGESPPLGPCDQFLRTGMLSRELASRGCEVIWFNSRFDHGRKRDISRGATELELQGGVRLIFLAGPGYSRNASLQRVIHQHKSAASFRAIARMMKKPDLIVAAYPPPELCAAAARVAADLCVPFVLDARDPWPDSFVGSLPFPTNVLLSPLSWYYRKLLRKSVKSAGTLVAMSDGMLRWVRQYAAAAEATPQGAVFYLGYLKDFADPQRLAPAAFTQSDPLVSIFYGMFGKFHNGGVVIRAARILAEQGERRIRFIMAGDGDQRSQWERLAGGLDTVEFTGWLNRTEANAHLQRAHVGFVTIRGGVNKFWLGNKFFEYTAHSLAIINDTTSELADLVSRYDMGRNVAEDSAPQIVDVLTSLVESPGEVELLRKNAARLFRERCDASKTYRDYADFLIDRIGKAPERQ